MLKFDYIHNKGYITADSAFQMDYGTAGHKFIHSYMATKDIQAARKVAFLFFMSKCLKVPANDFRTLDHLNSTTQAYTIQYPIETEPLKPDLIKGEPALELPFQQPLEMFFDPTTYEELYTALARANMKIVLAGTVDLKGTYFGDSCISDHKFTAMWREEQYIDGFRLNIQTMFYSWVWRKLGLSNIWLPLLMNVIFLKNPTMRSKDPVTKRLVPNTKWTGANFKRSDLITFTDEMMEKFESWLLTKLKEIIHCHTVNSFPQNFTACETVFGPCKFRQFCISKPHVHSVIANNFLSRKYEPWTWQA